MSNYAAPARRKDSSDEWQVVGKIELHRGSLDYAEYVMDPKNKDSTPDQLGEILAYYMEVLSDEDWSMVRFKLLKMMRKNRKRAEIKERRIS